MSFIQSKLSEKLSDRISTIFIYMLMIIIVLICLYPVILVVSLSISDPVHVMARDVYFLPQGFSIESYAYIMNQEQLWKGYANTIFYTVVGTSINVVLTILTAYALSRPKFVLKNPVMLFISFTMFFGGGLIPSFIINTKLGLYNSRWAMLLIGAISAYNVIVARTFLQNIPESLHESSIIDGVGEFRIFTKIYLPLSMPIIAVLILYYAVGHWNSYFNAMIYLKDQDKQPVQLYLIRIVKESDFGSMQFENVEDTKKEMIALQMKYSVITVVMLPIILVYPFLQKYFVKGVMIGAIKQ